MNVAEARSILGSLPDPEFGMKWPDFAALGLGDAPMQVLLEIALEQRDDEEDEAAREAFPVYRALHSWRALFSIHAMDGMRAFLFAAKDREELWDEECLTEDIARAVAISPGNLRGAAELAKAKDLPEEWRQYLRSGIGDLAERFPEARCDAADALCDLLAGWREMEEVDVSFGACNLSQTRHAKAIPLLREIFAAGAVDLTITDWDDILEDIPDAGPDPTPPEVRRERDELAAQWLSRAVSIGDTMDAVRESTMPGADMFAALLRVHGGMGADPGTFREKKRSKNQRKPKKKKKKGKKR